MPKHGEYIADGEWRNSRWCEWHQGYHGALYPCPHYPQEVLQEITDAHTKLVSSLQDEHWVRGQLENDIPPEAIMIMALFTGVRPAYHGLRDLGDDVAQPQSAISIWRECADDAVEEQDNAVV